MDSSLLCEGRRSSGTSCWDAETRSRFDGRGSKRAQRSRSIVVITDKPVFYLGAGRAEPAARENFQVALIEMKLDDKGTGAGTMAAAAASSWVRKPAAS